MDKVVLKKIGKYKIHIPESHQLPVYLKNLFYDQALPRISEYIKSKDGYLSLIDVGANIGDTVSLVLNKTSGEFLCIEGDKVFLPLLIKNCKKFKNCNIFIEPSYCSDSDETRSFSINRNYGTATLQSTDNPKNQSQTFKLDTILKKHSKLSPPNIIKIDTDGFEINVLNGSTQTLIKHHPYVFFEFTPQYYLTKNQDPYTIFDILLKSGYNKALFYNNFGIPVQVASLSDRSIISELISNIDQKNVYYYDVLAIPKNREPDFPQLFQYETLHCLNVYHLNYQLRPESDLNSNSENNTKLQSELNQIKSSIKWRLISKIEKIASIIIPRGSIQRKLLKNTFKLFFH